MNSENPEILFKDHLKIYVLPKDKIIFESELKNENIDYYCDIENQPMFESGIRYFILFTDRVKIDRIFLQNSIIAHTETIPTSDYRDDKRTIKLYLKIGAVVMGIMIVIVIIEKFLP